MAIEAISTINTALPGINSIRAADSHQEEASFKDMLLDAINNVNDLQLKSDAVAEDYITGRTDSIHDVMITATEASLALDFMIEVRNKVMEAYQEIMRMSV